MPKYQEEADVSFFSPTTKSDHEYYEVDLVDVIGFVWRSRFYVLAGIFSGLLTTAFYWHLEHGTQPANQITYSHWSLTYEAKEWDDSLAVFPTLLTNFLKTKTGAKAFYAGFSQSLHVPEEWIRDLVAKQREGSGLVQDIEFRDSRLHVSIVSPPEWTQSQITSSVSIGLQHAIKTYNQQYGELQDKIVDAQTRMVTIKLKAIDLLEKHKTFTKSSSNMLFREFMREYGVNPKPETIIFLLAAVAEHDEERRNLINSYSREFAVYEVLRGKSKAFAKELDAENLLLLPDLGEVSDAMQSNSQVAPSVKQYGRLPVSLMIGIVIGVFLGLGVSAIVQFWKKNKSRFQAIVRAS